MDIGSSSRERMTQRCNWDDTNLVIHETMKDVDEHSLKTEKNVEDVGHRYKLNVDVEHAKNPGGTE